MATKTKRKSLPKKQLKPETGKNKPFQSIFFGKNQTSGVWVTPDTALSYSAYWACINYIANSISMMPLDHREKKPKGGSDTLDSEPVYLLNTQANPETQADVFRKTLLAHALNWGNGYAEIERTLSGRPAWLWQITPDRVKVDRVKSNGQLVYDVCNPVGPNTVLLPEDVIHFKGLGFDGLVGYSVVAYAAKSIGSAIAADSAANSVYANDSTPGGLLKTPNRLNENARNDAIKSWEQRHSGPNNKRRVALLEAGLEYQAISMSPEATQLIESRNYGPVDICRWFGVPPHKVGILDRATFSNIESQQIQAVTDCLMPWIITIEKELNVKLIGRNLRGIQFFKHEMKGLLRADSQMRGQWYQWLLDRGVYDINEVLELEDMNPIGPDGEKRFVQRNMITLDQAGMPEPVAPSAGPASPQDTPQDKPQEKVPPKDENMPALLTPIISDSMSRILRRESRMAADAKDIKASLPNIRSKQAEYVRESLKVSVEQLVKTLKPMSPDAVAACSINVFLQTYDADIEKRCLEQTSVDGLADHYTNMLVRITTAMANS